MPALPPRQRGAERRRLRPIRPHQGRRHLVRLRGAPPLSPLIPSLHWRAEAAGQRQDGGSSHWESSDLLRWKEVRPGWFSGLTGAITRTPAGFFAIYVDGGMVRKTAHGQNLSDWSAAVPINHTGVAGGMDPAQAFLLEGSWRLPVLSGDGRLSLMRATDDTLASWDSAAIVLNESEFSGHGLVTALPSDADCCCQQPQFPATSTPARRCGTRSRAGPSAARTSSARISSRSGSAASCWRA